MSTPDPTEQPVWDLLNELRGTLSLSEVLAPLAALLILRWADQQEADREAIAAFDGTSFTPTLMPGSRWRDWCDFRGLDLADSFIEWLVPSIEQTRDAGAGALVRRIGDAVEALVRLAPSTCSQLVDFVHALPLSTPSDREQALVFFDELLSRSLDANRGSGEFVTPKAVVDLVVELASPQPHERIYDPCFGFAAVLAGCARRVRERLRTSPPRAWMDAQRGAFLGVELRSQPFVIGLARMILAGVDLPALELGNALERPTPKDRAVEGFDCIVADPPVGGKLSIDAASQFPVKATSAEALFLQHIMASLKPGGRAVVMLPQSALFRGGPDAAVRRLLLEEYRVEAIVLLPPGAYSPYTSSRSSVLVFRREPPGTRVRFVDTERPRQQEADESDPLLAPAVLAACVRGESTAFDTREVSVDSLLSADATFLPDRHDSALPVFVQAVQAADPQMAVRPLKEVADVLSGISHNASNLVSERASPSAIGFLRVTELKDGDTRPPTRFLTPVAAAGIARDRFLRPGDVLLTRSGSIGRVAVVANGAIGCVAAQGIAVLRPRDGLSPQYLLALLQSMPIQSWMMDRAHGVTIQHLSLSDLRRLEIPVPDLALQDRIVRALRREGGDAAALLLRALTTSADDPVASWLESSAAVQHIIKMKIERVEDVLDAVERIALEIRAARNRAVHSDSAPNNELVLWVIQTADDVAPIVGLADVPIGSARLAILEMSHRGILRSMLLLAVGASTIPVWSVARNLSMSLGRCFDFLIEQSAASFRLIPALEPASITAAVDSIVTLRLRNEGNVAVRNVVMRARDLKLEGKARYLEAGQELSTTVTVSAPTTPGALEFVVMWEALRLDGQRATGSIPLSLSISAAQKALVMPSFGTSPYIVGSPVAQKEMLYGRDAILAKIRRQLPTDHRANIIVLEGNRRTGKTSILKQLEPPGALPGWIVVPTNLQGGEGSTGRGGLTTKETFRLMARDIVRALAKAGSPVWFPDAPPPDPSRHYQLQLTSALDAFFDDDHPLAKLEVYLTTVLEAIAPRRLLLMLDEFDKVQEGIEAGVTSPQLPENIRYLFHTYPQLGGILSGSRRLRKLRNEYWSALFGIGYPIQVGALLTEDARALVTGPTQGLLVFVQAARDLIVDLCACQPFLIQTLCNHIFEAAAERGEPMVTLEAVTRAAAEMTVESNEHFATLWGYARTERRRLILFVISRSEQGSERLDLDAGVLIDVLADLEIPTPEDGLGRDIDHLRELELVQLVSEEGYQRYRLTVPLMANWIQRNKDASDLILRAKREEEEDEHD